MKHAIRQSRAGRTRQVVVDDDGRCAADLPAFMRWAAPELAPNKIEGAWPVGSRPRFVTSVTCHPNLSP